MTDAERLNIELAGAKKFADLLIERFDRHDADKSKPKTKTAKQITRDTITALMLEAEVAGYRGIYKPETHGPRYDHVTACCIGALLVGVVVYVVFKATGVL